MHKGKIVGNENKYRINHLVANGAFSQVYVCTSLSTGARYAVKVINRGLAEKNNMAAALIREVNAMEVMGESPFVASIIDKLISRHNYYIIMDLAEGGTLLEYLRQVRPAPCCGAASCAAAPPAAAARCCQCWVTLFLKQLLLALETIHAHDIVHRDVKPENILLNKEHSRIKLSDFGFACYAPAGGMLYRGCGTLKYCAPELLQEDPAYDGRKVDVWAAGVTLYVMLFNTYPYLPASRHADPDAMLALMAASDYAVPPNAITAEMEDLLAHMLCKDPAARWSVAQLLQHPCLRDVNVELPPSAAASTAALDHEGGAEGMPLSASSRTVFDDVDDGFYDRSSFARPPPSLEHRPRLGRRAMRSSISTAKSLSVDEDIVGMTEPFLHAQALMVSIESDSEEQGRQQGRGRKTRQQEEDDEEAVSEASGYASGSSGSGEEDEGGEKDGLHGSEGRQAEVAAAAGARPRRAADRGGLRLGPAPSLGGRWRLFSVLGLFAIMTIRFLISVVVSVVPIPAFLQPVVDIVASPTVAAKANARAGRTVSPVFRSDDGDARRATKASQESDLSLLAGKQRSGRIVSLRSCRYSNAASEGDRSRIAASPSSLRSSSLFTAPSVGSLGATPVVAAPPRSESFPVLSVSPPPEKEEEETTTATAAAAVAAPAAAAPPPLTPSSAGKTCSSSLHEESNDVSHDRTPQDGVDSAADVRRRPRLLSSHRHIDSSSNRSSSNSSNNNTQHQQQHEQKRKGAQREEAEASDSGSDSNIAHAANPPNESSSGATESPLQRSSTSDDARGHHPTIHCRPRRASSCSSNSNHSSHVKTPYSPSVPLPRHPAGGFQAEDFPMTTPALADGRP